MSAGSEVVNMTMAGFEGNEFYFQDKDNRRMVVFSMEEVSRKTQELPLDVLRVPKNGNRREVFLQGLLSWLKRLGEGDFAIGESLILLSIAKQLNKTSSFGDFLLLGESATSPFSQALARLIECFSLDSRLYCLGGGEGRERLLEKSSQISVFIDNQALFVNPCVY